MKFHDALISQSPHVSLSGQTVSVHAKLQTVADTFDLTASDYLLVADDRHLPIGVVSTQRIRDVLSSPHDRERARWKGMPVESVMDARLSPRETPDQDVSFKNDTDCQAIRVAGELFAITTDDDVFVSWKTVEKTLQFALVDPVTSLPNRSVFNNHLHAECNRAHRTGTSVGVILIDIDFFKSVNDDHGHAAGDTILRLVAQSVRRNLRSYDLVARYGGDELAVICSGCRPGEIDIPLKRIQEGVAKIGDFEELPCKPPTLSIGACVVHSPEDMADPPTIIASADECLYHAKQAGRNCCFSTEVGQPPARKQSSVDPLDAYDELAKDQPNPVRRRES